MNCPWKNASLSGWQILKSANMPISSGLQRCYTGMKWTISGINYEKVETESALSKIPYPPWDEMLWKSL